MPLLLSLALHHDQDVVTARQRAAHLAGSLGFDLSEQTRIATAVSEIVRNAFRYAKGGMVEYSVDLEGRPQRLVIRVADSGSGIQSLDEVLSGTYRSRTGMGIGIQGARRLMDRFSIESSSRGTTVVLEKFLPVTVGLVTAHRLQQIAEELVRRAPAGLVEEIQRQNQDLLRALDELQRKQQELVHVNRELEDTNRGVVALYAELDEKADHLRRADEVKSRFLSNMTHEFRTPVNSIIGLARLLIEDREQAELTVEPEISYIRDAAEQLSELVNDLLDLAKVEAGKTVVRPAEFRVSTLFGALRGMLRPLLLNQSVSMMFEDAEDLPILYTDEGKVSQILRNLISNGLKFTERGEVRITAATGNDGTILFQVRDTGIGIGPEDQSRIFDEFTQVEHRLQRKLRGTGLGLPLSKRLAELLGGTLSVSSEPGIGSTFMFRIPMHYRSGRPEAVSWVAEPGKAPLLIVEDAPDAQYLFERTLRNSSFQIYPARTVAEAELALKTVQPVAVILDIMIGNEEAWDVLVRMKRDDRLMHIPVVVISALSDREKAAALGAAVYLPKPFDRRILLETLDALPTTSAPVRVLAIDDDERIRLIIRQCLSGPQFEVREALSGEDGLGMARSDPPDVVLLDLLMPGLDGWQVLAGLRGEESMRHVPVAVVTSAALDEDARERLLSEADALLSKSDLTRDTLTRTVRALAAGRGDSRKTPQSL